MNYRITCFSQSSILIVSDYPDSITISMCLYNMADNIHTAVSPTIIHDQDFIRKNKILLESGNQSFLNVLFNIENRDANGDLVLIIHSARVQRMIYSVRWSQTLGQQLT